MRRWGLAQTRAVLWLGALSTLFAILASAYPHFWSISILTVPLVLGSLLLGPRHLPWFVVFTLAAVALTLASQTRMWPDEVLEKRTVVAVVTVFVVGLIILLSSFRRSRLGVAGATGESMLVDLRDRIQSQGELPTLPSQWYAETALRSAGGTPFAGDFVVASRTAGGRRLEVAVVDVSGKGEQAGARSLLLSGAFGGLLSALSPADFLSAANDYLLRQDWDEGFATAIHLSLDLETGDYEVRSAGHPPAVQLVSGQGRWIVLETEGPLLGLLEDADFVPCRGTMRRGDAILLYTDGLVETPDRDIGLGIDKLVGQSERLLRSGFDDGARRLIDRLGSRNDDRALLLVHRR